ncbi:MAG TPA: hypothetical protein VLV54_20985, partial [Thermoanaerobaculia bacterium]|nr:hypothetical protein [Thermoanaerobaculia bacterium]
MGKLLETPHEKRLRTEVLSLPIGQPPTRQGDPRREKQGAEGEGQEGAENAGLGCRARASMTFSRPAP